MGQNESTQRLHKAVQSVEKIRKDVRNDKIKANDVDRIQGILQKIENDTQANKNFKPRQSDPYTLEQLIDITSKELNALREEVNLDRAAVQTNSFRRDFSKRNSKQKRKSIKSINEAVQDIRRQIRSGKVENPQDIQAELANFSQELSRKGNKQEADKVQKLISSISQELITKQQKEDSSVPRTNSTNSLSRKSDTIKSDKRSSTIKEQETRRQSLKVSKDASTLYDIEHKLEFLKNDINVAESNKDKNKLRFLAKSIQTLMTDLQMVNVKNDIINEERKELLEKNLQRLYQQVDKIKKQINTESNLSYLVELEKKQKKERCLQELEELKQTLKNVELNLNQQNYQNEKENFFTYKNKVDSMDDLDDEIKGKKVEITDSLLGLENTLSRLEQEDRLNQAEWRHCQYKIDLEKFTQTTEHEVYKKHRQYLLQLRDYVAKILEVSQKVDEKKKYVLYNINNNIVALDKKAEENEAKQKKKSAIDDLLVACKEISSRSSEDIEKLREAKAIIEQKLNPRNQTEEKEDTILVRIKEKEIEPDVKSLVDAIDSVQQEVSNLPTRNNAKIVLLDEDLLDKKPEDVRVLQITKKPDEFEKISKELEILQARIENSRYSKDSQFYIDAKNKIDNYRGQIDDGVLDHVSQLLELNSSVRKSTTEDILVDIMSIGTRVNDLGSKVQNFAQTREGYDSIKRSLLENRRSLTNLQISPNRGNLYKSKEDILQQIDTHLSNIDNLKKNEISVSEDEKRFSQELRKLKEKVSRYSGTYKNVLYKSIEDDLDKHLRKVDTIFKDPDVAFKIKRDIENSKMILEQKSTKDHHYDQVKHEIREVGHKELTEIKQNIETVRKELNQSRPLTKEELDKLDATLTLSIVALDNIKDEKYAEEKNKLYQDVNYYYSQIKELKVVSRPHSLLGGDLHQKHLSAEERAANVLATIRQEFDEIKSEILSFVGTETSPNFLHLDEVLVRSTLKLDELNIDMGSDLYRQKVILMKEIHKYSDILDERINQTEEIEKLENDVKVMLMKLDSFNGYFGDSEYQFLDEEIIKLKVSLGKLHVNQELIERREACIRDVDSCMKKLKDVAKTHADALAGTLV